MKKSRLGQNFLFDPSIARRIVDSAGINHDDTVVEIGPGYGTMTRILAEKVRRLIAIEFDTKLYQKLSDELRPFRNTELVNRDVMKYDFSVLGPFKVVANIPYYITTPIIFKLIDEGKHLRAMTLTIQKEVAERIVADPGGKEYGVLSLMVQYYGNAKILFQIPARAFTPRPKVDSAVIRIERHSEPPVELRDSDIFRRIIKTAFAGRRKMIGNTLKILYPDIRSVLDAGAIDPKRRPETLTMAEFAAIANRISVSE
ncbi:MAG: 16S rRNA (adenine(1518)-N(6)/adenine(1519)-N(6))-dimethyltransferase RsmA [bacterium]